MNELDKQVLEGMTGQERLKVLLRGAGFDTYRDFAIAIGRYVEEVSMCLSGRRPYPEIRDHLAAHLGIARTEVDRLIDGLPAQSEAEDPAA